MLHCCLSQNLSLLDLGCMALDLIPAAILVSAVGIGAILDSAAGFGGAMVVVLVQEISRFCAQGPTDDVWFLAITVMQAWAPSLSPSPHCPMLPALRSTNHSAFPLPFPLPSSVTASSCVASVASSLAPLCPSPPGAATQCSPVTHWAAIHWR